MLHSNESVCFFHSTSQVKKNLLAFTTPWSIHHYDNDWDGNASSKQVVATRRELFLIRELLKPFEAWPPLIQLVYVAIRNADSLSIIIRFLLYK